ncbi:MAG: hypothetical protein HOQ03_14415 [Thermoleophilia bacterium]|nr:hypothetical protein [Thermoleophilia bacterium]
MILGALAGGLIGTVVLTSGSLLAQNLGWTRMDIPLLLGTIFSADRGRASVIGYAIHFANGLVFALAYGLVFEATGRAGWLFGLLLGAVHGAFAGGGLLNVLLPAVHPRMGKRWTDARSAPVLEPPGFLLSNYGPATLVATFALHLVYGAIVGTVASI